MFDFKALENFYLVLLFIVPGLVALFVRSKFLTGRTPSHTENILSYMVLSLVYYSIVILFIEPALAVREPWLAMAFIWTLLVLVGPAIFGFALGVWAQKEWGTSLAHKLGLTVVHVIPTAWDWRFCKVPGQGNFVLVTLTSGERVAGYFGPNSFASSDSSERDLYIEEEYIVTEQGDWQARPEKVGVLIAAKEIRYAEFWNPTVTEETNG